MYVQILQIGDETFIHLISDCPVFIEDRLETFKTRAFQMLESWTPSQILHFAKIPDIYKALTAEANCLWTEETGVHGCGITKHKRKCDT